MPKSLGTNSIPLRIFWSDTSFSPTDGRRGLPCLETIPQSAFGWKYLKGTSKVEYRKGTSKVPLRYFQVPQWYSRKAQTARPKALKRTVSKYLSLKVPLKYCLKTQTARPKTLQGIVSKPTTRGQRHFQVLSQSTERAAFRWQYRKGTAFRTATCLWGCCTAKCLCKAKHRRRSLPCPETIPQSAFRSK